MSVENTVKQYFERYGEHALFDKSNNSWFYSNGKDFIGGRFKKKKNVMVMLK